MDSLTSSAADSVSEVSAALASRTAEVAADIYGLIVREIPQLRNDKRVLALLEASVGENVATVLHILQHDIDLENVHAPAAAEEYARRLAQRGVPIAALLRAYRIGSARFQDWCFQELARRTESAPTVSAAGLRIAGLLAAYIDRVSEELVSAYESAKENWLRNLSVARAARVRALLRGERVDVDSSEAILGYRLRQNHVGVVAWITGAAPGSEALGRLEHAIAKAAAEAGCDGRPMFVPQDESSAWAWLPLGAHHSFAAGTVSAGAAGAGAKIRFAFGAPARGVSGFRRTHRQALSAHAVALAAGPPRTWTRSWPAPRERQPGRVPARGSRCEKFCRTAVAGCRRRAGPRSSSAHPAGVAMLHVRLDVITGDPLLLGDSIGYIESEVRPVVESQPGSLGMSLHANPERGVLVAESFWASRGTLGDSEPIAAPSRDEAVRRAKGTAAVERYEVPVFEREASFGAGEGVRLARLDVEPRAAEDAIAWFGDTAVPWLADTDGFRGALLYADRASGHLISETVWRNPQALAASRSAAAAIERAAVEATNGEIGAVEECRMMFSTARTA